MRPTHAGISLCFLLFACGYKTESASPPDALQPADAGFASDVSVIETFDIAPFNTALIDGAPTVDLAFYITEEGPLSWTDLSTNISRAQRIFLEAGVQIRVSSAMQISVPPDWQRLDPDLLEVPLTPEFLETDLYAHLAETKARPSTKNRAVFEAITSYFPVQASGVPAANTIHIVTLQEVPIAYYDWTGSEWQFATAPTGGLSFPPYIYGGRMPIDIRGVISLSFEQDQFRPESRVLAHEIGHKIINVSHEGVGVCPSFEANGPELMLYGSGEEIPAGLEGRWHKERLLRSPFLYTLVDGVAAFANEYSDGGVYGDALYGDYVVNPVCGGASK